MAKKGVGSGRQSKSKGYTPEDFRAVAASVRTLWMLNKKIPTLEEIDGVCDRRRGVIAKVLSTEAFMDTMDITGVPWRKHKGLSAKQHYMLVILTDPTDKRSLQQRLSDGRVTYAEYTAWLRNPIFKSFIEQFAEAALGDHMHVAHNSLMKAVERQNVAAIQFYYELTGRYNPRAQQERDIQAVLAQVLEIIQRRVTDPEELAAIAEDMRVLMGGAPRKELPAYRSEDYMDVDYEDIETIREEKYRDEGWVEPAIHVDKTYKPASAFEEKLNSGAAAVPSFMDGDISRIVDK